MARAAPIGTSQKNRRERFMSMLDRRKSLVELLFVIMLTSGVVPLSRAGDEVFDARGMNPNRPFFSQLPYEQIDPLNGNLLLLFTDLSLPGNAGFDLKIQRSYNSKIFRDQTFGSVDWDSWAGVGWSLHLGRVKTTSQDLPLAFEMHDGSSHKLFPWFVDGSGKYVTRDYWLYDRSGTAPKLQLTNGIVYTFDKTVQFSSVNSYYRYPTRIEDAFGNRVDITYSTASNAPPDAFDKITQYLGPPSNPGSQKREITFTTEAVGSHKRLKTMTYSSRTWTFEYEPTSQLDLPTKVTPPVGRPWKYGYTISGSIQGELTSLTTPNGGTISYSYGTQGGGVGALAPHFYYGTDSTPVTARVVASRTSGGRDVPAGTISYAYAQGANNDRTVVTSPASCGQSATGNTTEYTFLGVGDGIASTPVWRVGLLGQRDVKAPDGTVLETEVLAWRPPASEDSISTATEQIGQNIDAGIYAPVVAIRTITRGGQTYTTTNTYHSQAYAANGANFNDYGRPYQVDETGDAGTRTTLRTFQYGFTSYIKDRVATETVTVGSESFKRSWVYASATGFPTDEYGWGGTTTNGIHTQFAATTTGTGNIESVTDGNNHKTSYTYDWGVRKNVQTPAYPSVDTMRRVINSDGTIQSETRRLDENSGAGYRTSYTYDNLMRIKTVTPPEGAQTSYDYDDGNPTGSSFVKRSRGTTFLQTNLDGFGRPSGTENAVGVKTDVSYDACGRKSYESLPFDSTHSQDTSGFAYQYDALGRTTSRANPGTPASSVSYRYAGTGLTGVDVEVTDEESTDQNPRKTVQQWAAFGDPGEARLAAITLDSGGTLAQTTNYTYNALGSLTGVSGDGSRGRSFTYTVKNELLTETHPEKGTTTYTYDSAGNMATAEDALGLKRLGYDANNRLICVDQPPAASTACSSITADDVTIGYDRGDNRTSLSLDTSVSSTFTFDGADRLTTRTDTVTGAPQSFVTGYSYDTRDNLEVLTYPAPSTTAVKYTYDAGNRITDIRQNGTSSTWAGGFGYHPSGAPESFTAGNGVITGTTYTGRQWTDLVKVGVSTDVSTDERRVLGLDYGYDKVGNVTSVADNTTGRSGFGQVLTPDHLDRVATATGPWGSVTYGVSAFGDRNSRTLAGATTTYAYDSSTGRLTGLTGAETDSFGYNDVGSLTSASGATYSYTLRSMLKTATVGGSTTTYGYDGDDLRMKKSGPSSTRYYVHGPGGSLLSEFASCGAGVERVRDYVYAGSRLVVAVRQTPTVAFTVAGSSVLEGPGAVATVEVTLTTTSGCPTTSEASVSYATSNGTALAGSDYAAVSDILRFREGSISGAVQTIQVPILDDEALEQPETFNLSLAIYSGASLGAQRTHMVTIQDDDVPSLTLVAPANATVSESGAWMTAQPAVRIQTKDGNATVGPVSVSYSGSGGTAVAGSDYQASGTVPIPKGTLSGTVTPIPVTILYDGLAEGDETFNLNLSNPVQARIDTPSTTVVTIADDDVRATKTVAGAEEPGGTVVYTISLIRPGTGVPATQTRLTDTLPAELTVTQATAPSGTVSTNGKTVTWTGALAALGAVDVTMQATIASGAAGAQVSNQGTVLFDGNGDGVKEAQALTDDPTLPGAADPTVFQVGTGPVSYYTLTPCRLVDTRNPTGSLGGPALGGQADRTFSLRGVCEVPATARALAVNLTVTGATGSGNLRLHPPGLLGNTSSINYTAGLTRANNAIVALDAQGRVAVFCNQPVGSTVDFILDVNGYFE
jgi:uncharacterized repeat protein (TIGR01451 family)